MENEGSRAARRVVPVAVGEPVASGQVVCVLADGSA